MKEQEKQKATVLRLYSAGSKVADIVTQTDVPRSTVYYLDQKRNSKRNVAFEFKRLLFSKAKM